ncbi:MAG: methyl-accepting chemotaxis protein [Clostridiales bacterium]|nr:methyl-accepting chemotaxis protein [Clostridiales bacterium]
MRVSLKLITSFLIVVAMTLAVGGVGIVGMLQINKGASSMYEMQTVPMPNMAKSMETMQKMRVNAREYLVGTMTNDNGKIETTKTAFENDKAVMAENLDLYGASIIDPTAQALFKEARDLYENDYLDFMDKCYSLAKADNSNQLIRELDAIRPTIDKIVDNFEKCLDMKVDRAKVADDSNDSLATKLLVIIAAVLVIVVAVALFLAFYVSGLISKPLGPLTTFLKRASESGDISLRQEDIDVIGKLADQKDEIGQCIGAAASFVTHVTQIGKELETIAAGDLTADVAVLSDNDTMGLSLQKVMSSLNNMFGEINAATGQVSTGAKQVADGAQSLAQGSTQQAATIEELSGSITEIAERTKANAVIANKTSKLSESIKESAEKGSRQMDEMISAVGEINEASINISKIIKTIDDIAFQTNILALNAAVEAARAGQHGKGFAVVAEEVRNLASKSAEAAKDTGAMIQNSMEKAELGSRIAGETAASLGEIVTGIIESTQLISEIAEASEEQSQGISQINIGIDQVAQVVQQNSATAEESAAASEEMNGQSDMLQQLIAQFKLKDNRWSA